MSDKASTPDTTNGVIKATRTGNRLFSLCERPHEHPTNALDPLRAYGTAGSQFWFDLRHDFIEILVHGNQTYTLNDPASHRDAALRVQEAQRAKHLQRARSLSSLKSPSTSTPGAPYFHHLNFSSFLLTPYSPETLCGFDLRRAQLIPHRFPNLKSIVINLELCPGLAEQSFTMPEAMRVQFATVLLMQGVARDVPDAMARVDESCRREWETIHGVLVKVMQHLREILGGRVGKRPAKDLGRDVMGQMGVDLQVVADVMMSEEGQRWLIPF